MATLDNEEEFQRGMGLLDETIETMIFGLDWKVDACTKAEILRQLKQIQSDLSD